MLFDSGVFLTVVGAVMLALAQLSLLGSYTRDFDVNAEPMDVDPSGRGFRRRRKTRPTAGTSREWDAADEWFEDENHDGHDPSPQREHL